jgi:hypothetical protein
MVAVHARKILCSRSIPVRVVALVYLVAKYDCCIVVVVNQHAELEQS